MRNKSRQRKKQHRNGRKPHALRSRHGSFESTYAHGCHLAEQADYVGARAIFGQLAAQQLPSRMRALVQNDIGTLDVLAGDIGTALDHFEQALGLDPDCNTARQNLDLLKREGHLKAEGRTTSTPATPEIVSPPVKRVRIAILSELFNWPSTGGGTVHTAETGKFLSRTGYDVRHIYAQHAEWGIGNVTLPLDHPAEALVFEPADWNASEIQRRFREAVDRFSPDYVIITDSWNFKPLLAEAVRGYRYFLRLAAQECLCPLNNVRLLVDDQGRFSACPRNQLATAETCRQCVSRNQHHSGGLHQAERALSGYGTAEYDEKLRRAFAEAEGVLAVNPLIAAAVSPFAKAVHVVPSGFDADRFPWPWPDEQDGQLKTKMTIFFAGIVEEYMKGFHVLHAACTKLWKKRQDFELVATADPPGTVDAMTRFIGWLPQSELPRQLRQADFLVFPTIAEEALGRSAVEAMGVGRPVIASRIGGLPFTVTEGLTGLLFEPGNADELANKIEVLLDDPTLRERIGAAARQRFVERFTWEAVIDAHYRKLLKPVETEALPSVRIDGSGPPADEGSDTNSLVQDVAEFFGMAHSDVERMFGAYSSMRGRQSQAAPSGQSTELSLTQGFVICMLLSLTRPETIVVAGGSAGSLDAIQRFHDLKSLVGLTCQVVRYDGHVAAVTDDENDGAIPEAVLNVDQLTTSPTPTLAATGSFQGDILDRFGSGLIWLVEGTDSSTADIISSICQHFGQWTLAAEGKSRHGSDASDIAADVGIAGLGFAGTSTDQTNFTHRLKVFAEAERLTLIVPKSLVAQQHPP